MEILPELRDIHLPEGVSAFPPAYGWWIILGTFLLSVCLYKLWIFFRQKSKKLYALRLLSLSQKGNIVAEATDISEILRRICLVKYPQAKSLSGTDWLDFLNNHCSLKLSGKASELLKNAPYIPTSSTYFNHDDLLTLRTFCQKWIGENL